MARYRTLAGIHDEMLDHTGAVRPGWATVAEDLLLVSAEELLRRRSLADRLLVAEGAGHVVHDDEQTSRAWRLDPVPMLVGHDEWAVLARGLVQRARLLEAVAADLTGDRTLLTTGVVPPAAVLSWSGYQRATSGLPSAARRLTLYGPDLVRRADGAFVVIADHTDVPVGAGLALLQRSVASRLLPDLHRRAGVAPLGDLSAALRGALAAHAPPERSSPRVVVHTTGPGRAEYLDHSYLASELGYHVVTGDDLTVRGGRLWLRSLGRLEPVDVVLRRVPDHWIDPLEVPPGGPGGVPGLLQAAREGGAGVANLPGSGIAGHLALLPFLGAACHRLLGEDLLLPSTDTWWCGLTDHREEVLGAFDDLVLHDVGQGAVRAVGGWAPPVFARDLDPATRASWRSLIDRSPHRVVAQRRLDLATTPGVVDGGPVAQSVVIRAVVVSGPEGCHVLPGGHGRVVAPETPALAQGSGTAKDIWVLAGSTSSPIPVPKPSVAPIDLRASLPSRAGESLFWMGRNAERAETVVRLVQVVLRRVEQEPELLADVDGPWLHHMLGGLRAVSGAIGTLPGPGDDPYAVLQAELAGALDGRPGSAADSLGHLVSSVRSIREHVSTSTWRIFGMLEAEIDGLRNAGAAGPVVLGETLDRVLVPLLAFSGLAKESMVRGPGWRLLDMGRRLERAVLLLGLLEATVVPASTAEHRQSLHESVLTACESLVAYRRRFRSDITPAGIAAMLVLDVSNPRSLAFQLEQLHEDLSGLPAGGDRTAQRAIVARAQDVLTDAAWLGDADGGDRSTIGLHALVLGIRPLLLELIDEVVGTWFAHAPRARRGAG
jgi:uncharacterized circularly permuted ATP-grasp superfamily protein/uncharacterized alpha-E superfamily protein